MRWSGYAGGFEDIRFQARQLPERETF